MTEAFSKIFAILTLVCFAAVVAVGVVAAMYRWRPTALAVSLFDGIRSVALWIGWLVAAVAMAGSLFYSTYSDFEPCELCWFQRICIYPFAVILLIAAIRRDTSLWRYGLPINAVGLAISVYHTQLQAFPEQQNFCNTITPCTTRYVWEFGFVSLPLMALAAQLVIATMFLVARVPVDDIPAETPS
jgi:disulfide bond formation protein DsbB